MEKTQEFRQNILSLINVSKIPSTFKKHLDHGDIPKMSQIIA